MLLHQSFFSSALYCSTVISRVQGRLVTLTSVLVASAQSTVKRPPPPTIISAAKEMITRPPILPLLSFTGCSPTGGGVGAVGLGSAGCLDPVVCVPCTSFTDFAASMDAPQPVQN